MPDDRTVPMQPEWSPQNPDFDDQETVFTDQQSVTPPTMPLGDQDPGFVQSTPAGETTPSPFGPAPGPFGPGPGPTGPPEPTPPADQTMLPNELLQALYMYDWPGNVRELQNILKRYLATRDMKTILSLLGSSPRVMAESLIPDGNHSRLLDAMEAFEKQHIVDMLARNQYHITKTAEMLGIHRITLHNKIKKHHIRTKP